MLSFWFRKSAFFVFFLAGIASAPAQEIIKLPAPKMEGGMPLMQALKERRSGREFSSEKLPIEIVSNLLWAAWGVNRPDGHRTAPSARNMQEIDVYVALSDGLFLYEPKQHQLQKILSEDIRAATGTNPYVKDAAVNLVYVADPARGNLTDRGCNRVLHRRRHGVSGAECVPVLRFGKARSGSAGKHRQACAGETDETATRPENHPGAVCRISEKEIELRN